MKIILKNTDNNYKVSRGRALGGIGFLSTMGMVNKRGRGRRPRRPESAPYILTIELRAAGCRPYNAEGTLLDNLYNTYAFNCEL